MKDGQLQIDLRTANQVRTLFKPSSWLTKIDFINHLILFNNVLITVLAEKTGGKTSFSSLLLNNLDQQIKPVFMSIQPPCDKGDVLGDIAAQLHLNIDADTNVASIVTQINERKAHVVLVIDDAQNIPEDLIKEFMVAIRSQEDFGFFHLCIVSDYSVVATLNNLAVDQFNNLIHTIELGSLSENETRTYVLQRAMAARLINKPLSDNQFKQFYQLTKGNIARINANLESFIFKCATQKESSKTILIVKRASIAAGIAFIGGVSFFYLKNLYSPSQYSVQHSLEQAISSTIPSIRNIINEHTVLAQEELVPSYIPSLHDSSSIQLVQNELPKKQVLDGIDEDQMSNTMALVDKVIVIPSVKKHLAEREAMVQAKEVHELQPINSTLVSHIETKQNNSVVARVARSSGFTIQLVASHKKSDVYRFKQSSKLYTETKIRYFTNQKGSWYILTIGDFNSRAQAQDKINKFPASIAKLKPWVRPLSGLAADKG